MFNLDSYYPLPDSMYIQRTPGPDVDSESESESESESALFAKCVQTHEEFVLVF